MHAALSDSPIVTQFVNSQLSAGGNRCLESLERYLDEQLDGLKQQGLLRSFRILEGPQGARARIDGQDVINLSSNNYLGLS